MHLKGQAKQLPRWLVVTLLVVVVACIVQLTTGIISVGPPPSKFRGFYPPPPPGVIPADYHGVIEVNPERPTATFMIKKDSWSPLIAVNAPGWYHAVDFPECKTEDLVIDYEFLTPEGKKLITLRGDESMGVPPGNKLRMRGNPGRVVFSLVPP